MISINLTIAGDLVKFGFPMAYAMTILAWGLIDYEDAYIKAGELENGRKAIKWGTDYFIKVSLILKYFLIAFMYYFLQS